MKGKGNRITPFGYEHPKLKGMWLRVCLALQLIVLTALPAWADGNDNGTQQQVSYVDENYETHTVNAYVLDENMTTLTEGEFYVVPSNGLTIDHSIGSTSSGNDHTVTIIIPDGATLSSEVTDGSSAAFSMSSHLRFYGQAQATGKLAINTTKNGIDISSMLTIANLDVEAVCGQNGLYSYSGSIIAGHQTKGNTLIVRSTGNGINGGTKGVTIKYCDVEITGTTKGSDGEYNPCGDGLYAGGYDAHITLTGRADGSNKMTIRSGNNGISAGSCAATITYYDADIYSTGVGISAGNYSNGFCFEGVATGEKVNKLTVRSNGSAINCSPSSVTIKYSDVEITGTTKDSDGNYNPCNGYGIEAHTGSGLRIIGRSDGSNKIKVHSQGPTLYIGGSSVTIQYCDIDILSKSAHGIYATSYGLTITGNESKGNNVVIRSFSEALYAAGTYIDISNCDMDITTTQSQSIFATSNPGLNMTSTLENGNTCTVRSTNGGGIDLEGGSMNITNYNIDIETYKTALRSLYPINVTNSTLKAICTGNADNAQMADFCGMCLGNNITATGSQITVAATNSHQDIVLVWGTIASIIKLANIFEGNPNVHINAGKEFIDAEGNLYTEQGNYTVAQLAGRSLRAFEKGAHIVLADNETNETIISLCANDKDKYYVSLTDRTFTRDGYWNTLCLPFNLNEEEIETQSVFNDATLMELDNSAEGTNLDIATGTLTLKFKAATAIEAGKPYIVKWEEGSFYYGNAPTFEDVFISNAAPQTITSADGYVKFVGQYSPFEIVESGASGSHQGNRNEIILLSGNNKLGYSQSPRTLRSCRAHFWIPASIAASVRSINLVDFDSNEKGDATHIKENDAWNKEHEANAWYTLDGRKLDKHPTRKGLYIVNGKKMVIK